LFRVAGKKVLRDVSPNLYHGKIGVSPFPFIYELDV